MNPANWSLVEHVRRVSGGFEVLYLLLAIVLELAQLAGG